MQLFFRNYMYSCYPKLSCFTLLKEQETIFWIYLKLISQIFLLGLWSKNHFCKFSSTSLTQTPLFVLILQWLPTAVKTQTAQTWAKSVPLHQRQCMCCWICSCYSLKQITVQSNLETCWNLLLLQRKAAIIPAQYPGPWYITECNWNSAFEKGIQCSLFCELIPLCSCMW